MILPLPTPNRDAVSLSAACEFVASLVVLVNAVNGVAVVIVVVVRVKLLVVDIGVTNCTPSESASRLPS